MCNTQNVSTQLTTIKVENPSNHTKNNKRYILPFSSTITKTQPYTKHFGSVRNFDADNKTLHYIKMGSLTQ